jgi:predicted nucleotidyltransferase
VLNSLDHILGTTAKVRLLRALLPLNSPASGREAERLAGVSHLSATRALDDLVALGVLDRTVTQATHLYRINREHDLVRPLETLFECESARLTSLREEIKTALTSAELAGAITSVGMFGSAARGEAQPDSDLDLLVLVTDRSRAEAASALLGVVSDRLRERYGARASVLVLSVPEARHRLDDGDPLLREIAHDSRTLFGTRIQEALDVW